MGILIRRRKKETLKITHEFVRILGPREVVTSWCNECLNATELLPPEDVAILMGVSAREIYRRVEIGDVHFTELSGSTLLICLSSIFAKASEPLNASNSNGLEWNHRDEE